MEAWLIDTSLWIHAYNKKNRPAQELISRCDEDNGVCICDPVALELMPGPSDETELRQLELDLGLFQKIETTRSAWRRAKKLVFELRRNGVTVNSMDALIAGIALSADIGILHCDRDFELIAEHAALKQQASDR